MQLAVRLGERDGARRPSTAAMSRATRSPGSNGASPAAVTIQRASGALAADQRMPASTPASGPTKPPIVSGTTGRPKAAKRPGSPLALITMSPTWGAEPADDVAEHWPAGQLQEPLVAAPHAPRPAAGQQHAGDVAHTSVHRSTSNAGRDWLVPVDRKIAVEGSNARHAEPLHHDEARAVDERELLIGESGPNGLRSLQVFICCDLDPAPTTHDTLAKLFSRGLIKSGSSRATRSRRAT